MHKLRGVKRLLKEFITSYPMVRRYTPTDRSGSTSVRRRICPHSSGGTACLAGLGLCAKLSAAHLAGPDGTDRQTDYGITYCLTTTGGITKQLL